MAARFWVGGTGTWDAATTTHWSTTSGGSGGASVPGASDDVTFDGSSGGGTVTVGAAYNPSVISITMGAFTGTLDFSANNNSPTMGTFSGTGTGTRTLNMGTGTWTVTAGGTGNAWDMTTTTNLTFSGASSTLTFTAVTSYAFQGGGLSYGTVNFTCGATGLHPLTGANTFANLTVTGGNSGGFVGITFTSSITQTVTGTLTFTGTSQSQRLYIQASTLGTQATISAAAVALSNVDITDINNPGTTWTGTSLGDADGNAGITFTTPATVTWTAVSGGNWAIPGNWDTGLIPLPQDSVVFNASSITTTGKTITANSRMLGRDITFATITNNPTLAWNFTGLRIYGSLTLAAPGSMSMTGAVTVNFIGRRTKTITSAGQTFPCSIQEVSGTGTLTFADAYTSTGAITLTSGTLDANNKNITATAFSSSGAITRTLNMGSGTWTLTGNNTTVWNTAALSNFTFIGTGVINCTYSGGTGTRTINTGTVFSTFAAPDFRVTAGTDIVSITNLYAVNVNFTGFNGTLAGAGAILTSGNVTLAAASVTYNGTITLSPQTGTSTFSTSGLSLLSGIVINGPATVQLADALTTSGQFTHTAGTFDANNMSVTIAKFNANTVGTKTLLMGNGTWTLTGNTGRIWDTASSNMTLNAGSSTIVMSDATANTKQFNGQVYTYNNLWLTGGGTGIFQIGLGTGSPNTFNNLKIDPGLTVQFFAGSTTNVSSFTVIGSSGSLITLTSTTNGTAWNLVKSGGGISVSNYLSLRDSAASPALTWYAGTDSVDVSGNRGWIFTRPPSSVVTNQNAKIDGNNVHTLLGTSNLDGVSTIRVTADPTLHSLDIDDATTGSDLSGDVASRDDNFIPVLMGVSSADGVTPTAVYADSTTGHLLVKST